MINKAPATTSIYSNHLFCSPNYSTSIVDTEFDWFCPKVGWKGRVNRHRRIDRSRHPLINIDSSSLKKLRELENESSSIPEFFDRKTRDPYSEEIQLAKAMLQYNQIGKMPPKGRKKVTLRIKGRRKGKLPDYEPEY